MKTKKIPIKLQTKKENTHKSTDQLDRVQHEYRQQGRDSNGEQVSSQRPRSSGLLGLQETQ